MKVTCPPSIESAVADAPSNRQTAPLPRRTGILVGVGLLAFLASHFLGCREDGLWLPPLGIGLALTAWLGQRVVPLLAIVTILTRLILRSDLTISQNCWDGLLLASEAGLSWWVYSRLAEGSRHLEDPRSATVFLILVPGVGAALFAAGQATFWNVAGLTSQPVLAQAGVLWISRILGILTFAPALLVVVTPYLGVLRMIEPDPPSPLVGGRAPLDWTWGEIIETAGLCAGSGILTLVLVALHVETGSGSLALWGLSLLLVVWASLRQGLRGGALASCTSGLAGLGLAAFQNMSAATLSPLQGNILAQCSTALLVGASAGWIRASESRYRQVVGQIPVVLYSVRLPRGFSLPQGRGRHREEASPGRLIVAGSEVTLVSSAARHILGSEPDALLGPYATWVERIHPEDRELVLATLTQLCMQKQTVSCEYRLAEAGHDSGRQPSRWVRDTFAPNYLAEGALGGWEGVIEDISEQRTLANNLRRTTGMFQALITHLPTGIFFVQGPTGHPLLVNARARQLLGQREDYAAGIAHLPKVYRLHRPDGSEYPAEELPVARALKQGVSSMTSDIVVHRPDGRKIPLIAWAAPVNIGGGPIPDAAVWVLEDSSTMQQAEQARKESEARLRAVFDTMAEGVVVQNQNGDVIECNRAACVILGKTPEELMNRPFLGAEAVCVREDGSPFPPGDRPDMRVLRDGAAVHSVLVGVPLAGGDGSGPELRWIYVSSVPLPFAATQIGNARNGRIVTTFAEITALRKAQEDLRRVHRLELVGRIAGGTLHDFNNLLTVMLGLAGMVQTTLPADHAAHADLQRLQEVGEQAAHLAGQLLAFTRQRQKPPQPTDLNTVVVHSLKVLKGVMPARIRLESQVREEELLVLSDETQLKQVVMNLCLNARDAIAGHGSIRVSVAPGNGGEGNGKPSGPDAGEEWVVLTVTDDGAGIDEAVRARIFEPFFSTKERGTGLGLAVVRQIVEDLGGEVRVHSKVGEGTRMEVWLRSVKRV